MKYRDLITIFLSLAFILSLGYTFGVDNSIWPIPVVIFFVLIFMVYKLWIEK